MTGGLLQSGEIRVGVLSCSSALCEVISCIITGRCVPRRWQIGKKVMIAPCHHSHKDFPQQLALSSTKYVYLQQHVSVLFTTFLSFPASMIYSHTPTPTPPHPRSFISESSRVRARSPHSRVHGGLEALLNYFKYGIAGNVCVVLFLTETFNLTALRKIPLSGAQI